MYACKTKVKPTETKGGIWGYLSILMNQAEAEEEGKTPS
jgi:hypothetical protein